ncbi:hypothetical protein LOK74_02110 [Brevibacillus humidisoli]|uniref:hypothetical protein n=1 Tax=Brevibacillus humidisoli TaxID=2895522 RepID=UPI001E368457|nr:hypothetical protein [Brevibacillus humidisoli]UFJ41355.1 hypothetical protein LOK74_02110 [Brevibacillus humidisoli]
MMLGTKFVPEHLVSLLQKIAKVPLSNHAGKAHYELVDFLEQESFFCECEHTIYHLDGRQERVDVMAHRDGEVLAIEVDSQLKRKSVMRLSQLEGGDLYRIIVILKGTCKKVPDDIHAVVKVPIKE